MKQISQVISLLLVMATAMLTSCLSSDDNSVTLHDDIAIESFTLGTLTRYYHPANKPDTTLKTTITGSYYPMTIDHLGQRIYNVDSLPVGTVPRVLCTITTKNSGIVGLKKTDADGQFYYFSQSDSVDFSQPRMFRVMSSDGTQQRDYEVTLNVAQVTGTTFGWTKNDSVGLIHGCDACRPVRLGNRLVIMASQGGTTTAYAKNNEGTWTALTPDINVLFEADAWKNIAVKDSFLYMLTNQTIIRTKNGQNWEQTASTSGIGRLLGAGTRELFAMGDDGRLKASRDEGNNWYDEQLDDQATLLPVTEMACVSFPFAPTDSTDYVLLVGNSADANDMTANVWRKLSFYTKEPQQSQWVYMPKDVENPYKLPRQDNLSMACHEQKILVVGSNLKVYENTDQGITWRESTAYALPTAITGTQMAFAQDGTELWLVTNSGQVWCGYKK